MAATAGCRSNAVAARPTPAFHLSTSVGVPRREGLEAALKCRSCRTPRYSSPIIELTETDEIAPYAWVNPDEDHKTTLLEIGVLKHCLSTAWSIAQASASDGSVSIVFDCASPGPA